MDFNEVIKNRYSCRKFKDMDIKEDDLRAILEAGRLAPTACNNQPQLIYVIRDKDILLKLKEASRFTFNSHCVLVICYDKEKAWHRGNDLKDHGDIDSAIVTTHMMLECENLGLGSTYVCSFKPKVLAEILGLSANIIPSAILPIGYKDEFKSPNSRKALEETIIYR